MPFNLEFEAFYSIEELEKAGVAARYTLRKWIRDGKLKAVKVGRKYVIFGQELKKLFERGTRIEY